MLQPFLMKRQMLKLIHHRKVLGSVIKFIEILVMNMALLKPFAAYLRERLGYKTMKRIFFNLVGKPEITVVFLQFPFISSHISKVTDLNITKPFPCFLRGGSPNLF